MVAEFLNVRAATHALRTPNTGFTVLRADTFRVGLHDTAPVLKAGAFDKDN